MLASYALLIGRRSRGFIAGSAPPRRAATVTSLISRVKILPFLASAAAFLCFTLAHLECPTMAERRGRGCGAEELIIFAIIYLMLGNCYPARHACSVAHHPGNTRRVVYGIGHHD